VTPVTGRPRRVCAHAGQIVVDATNLYWTTYGAIMKVPK
jgi:hypothetical protein